MTLLQVPLQSMILRTLFCPCCMMMAHTHVRSAFKVAKRYKRRWTRAAHFLFFRTRTMKGRARQVDTRTPMSGTPPKKARAEFGSVVYGVFKTYVNKGGSADVILGLVRNRDDDVRPSFLGQTLIQSVCLDFVSSTLTLSRGALILPGADFVPLVDLRTQFRAPVQHYVVLLQNLVVNDRLVRTSEPIYAMIDTGASGCFITENMFYPLQRQARGWRSMEVDITTYRGETVTLSARRPDPLFLVLPATYPWLPSDANLIVLGLSFLRNSKITLDLLQSKMLLRQFPENPSTA
mmetsp:Transcript_25383/g.47918  ORF Transcript_25383/g.47918 Transcript_25383/m.47918 type:complete len:292 (+) Transcript_25383:367-1242(+)